MPPPNSNLAADVGFEPLPLLAAWAFPGAGHFLQGDRARAGAICAGVMGLFLGGIVIGGIDVIDRAEDGVWFIGQAIVGPSAFAADWFHQHRCKVIDPMTKRPRSANPNEGRNPDASITYPGTPPNKKSIGRMNEIGTLSSTLAGMLNLIAIIDAGFPTRRRNQARA